MSEWVGVVVATTHGEVAAVAAAVGAVVVDSVERVADALAAPGSLGLFVTQDLPGVTPDRVRVWSADRPVAVWLEDDPPPAWRSLPAGVTVWRGELSEQVLSEWVRTLTSPAQFGDECRIGAVLALAGGVGATEASLRWGSSLAARGGPGLWVDADWALGGLTERLAPAAWRDRTNPDRPLPCRAGWILPAPPPWDIAPAPRESAEAVPALLDALGARFAVVDLGRDLRSWVAARWVAAADHVVILGREDNRTRAERAIEMLRELNPGVRVGTRGVRAPSRADRTVASLPPTWPDALLDGRSTKERGWGQWLTTKTVGAFARFMPGSPRGTWRR